MGRSILILDEDLEVLTFLTRLLEARKLRVLRARTKSEAFEILSREYIPVDLVLANLNVTRTSGLEFPRQVADIRPGVAVIYMSAFVAEGVIRVEAMKRTDLSGYAVADDRGVLDAVSAILNRVEIRRSPSRSQSPP
jgi:two-component SAPR family response regulator